MARLRHLCRSQVDGGFPSSFHRVISQGFEILSVALFGAALPMPLSFDDGKGLLTIQEGWLCPGFASSFSHFAAEGDVPQTSMVTVAFFSESCPSSVPSTSSRCSIS